MAARFFRNSRLCVISFRFLLVRQSEVHFCSVHYKAWLAEMPDGILVWFLQLNSRLENTCISSMKVRTLDGDLKVKSNNNQVCL